MHLKFSLCNLNPKTDHHGTSESPNNRILQFVQGLEGFVCILQTPNLIPPSRLKCLVKEMENAHQLWSFISVSCKSFKSHIPKTMWTLILFWKHPYAFLSHKTPLTPAINWSYNTSNNRHTAHNLCAEKTPEIEMIKVLTFFGAFFFKTWKL